MSGDAAMYMTVYMRLGNHQSNCTIRMQLCSVDGTKAKVTNSNSTMETGVEGTPVKRCNSVVQRRLKNGSLEFCHQVAAIHLQMSF